MVKTVPMMRHGTRPPGSEKTHNTCASSRASSLANSQKQQQHPSGTTAMATTLQNTCESGEGSQVERHINDCKEILYMVAGRLDEILERCTTLECYKKNVTSLAKFTREAADCDQGTIVQLTLVDMKAVQDEIKEELTSWCDTIECKLDTLDKKQTRILESTTNIANYPNEITMTAMQKHTHA